MRRMWVALPLLVGLFSICFAAQAVPRDLGTIEIKAMVNDVDSHLRRFDKSRIMLQTGTDRGGELTIYRRGSDVVRIDATIGGSSSDLHDVFYYFGASPIFVRTKMIKYPYSSTSNGFDFAAPQVKVAADYYVRDRKLIPLSRAKIAASLESRLLQEAELFMRAGLRETQVVNIEKLVK